MQLTQRILDYDQHLSESAYLNELAGSVAVADLFAAIVELLKFQDEETLSTTLLFIQDLILWGPIGDERQPARAQYDESIVVKALEGLLWSDHHWIRQQTGFVLGKTGSHSSLPVMTDAFHHWRDRDPLMLYFFIGELAWLGADNFHELVDLMISSQWFVTRWVAVSCLERFDDDSASRQRQQQRWEGCAMIHIRWSGRKRITSTS
jgi:hypothetical protein